MKRTLTFFSLAAVASCLAFVLGCEKPTTAPATTPMTAGGHDEHDHEAGEHAHPSEGPHHGHLIELGKEEYHAELTDDHDTHTITIYLLDGAAKKAVTSAEPELAINLVVDGKPTQFTLPAVPQDDDPAGESSRFQLVDETLCDALDAEKTTGRLNVTIGGKSFTGQIAHEAHGEHEHEDHEEETPAE